MKTLNKQQKEIRSAFADFVVDNIGDIEARSLGVEIKEGKVLVPKSVADEIIGYVEQHNPLRKYGKVVTVKGNQQYPVLTSDTVVKVEANSTERAKTGEEIEISNLGLKAVLLEPIDFDAVAIIKRKLIKTTPVSVEDLVIEVLKKEYLKKEIDYMFNGTDGKAFNDGSLFNNAMKFIPTETEPAKIIRELKNKPSSGVANNARWLVNKKAIEFVEDLVLPNGEPVLKTIDHEGAGVKYLILGFPVDVTDIAKGESDEKAVFYFGDFSSFVIQEDVNGLEIKTQNEMVGTYRLRNEVGIKLYHLLDGKLIYSDLEPTVYRLEI